MNLPQTPLGNISIERFLQEYWQKKPFLIRNGMPNFKSPISPDELAGLACEEEALARLIVEKDPDGPWQVKHGPFDESTFANLPSSNWSLLVQEVDQWVEEVYQLRQLFNFIPEWRIDDVMVSFAPKQGSVGPHTDNYDVFLVQGFGSRKWLIDEHKLVSPELIPNLDLKILKSFVPTQEWVLEPGDILYLPPNIAHHGIALEDCMTYSVGFRAPSELELITSHIESLSSTLEERFYSDSDLTLQTQSCEISKKTLTKICKIIEQIPCDQNSIKHWFGRLVTQAKREELVPIVEQEFSSFSELINYLKKNPQLSLERDHNFRIAYHHNENNLLLFINGEEYLLDTSALAFVRALCDSTPFTKEALNELENHLGIGSLIVSLFNSGYLGFV
ncbi:MAG: cupin domain-containing protein [Bdellovibrionota bacterium]